MRCLTLTAVLGCLLAGSALADCDNFKWDLARERTLYAGDTTAQKAATDATQAPTVRTDALYEIALMPQGQVKYSVPPGKKFLAEDAYGGIVAFTVPTSGAYRVGMDVPFWIDVLNDGQAVPTKDFGGPQDCELPPHKLVEFELQSGTRYLLQFSGQTQSSVHLTLVKSAAAKT